MFDVGGAELLVIILAVIVLFGPKKIPEFAQMLGKGVQKVRQAQSQFQEQMHNIQSEMNQTATPVTPPPPPVERPDPATINQDRNDGEQQPDPKETADSVADQDGQLPDKDNVDDVIPNSSEAGFTPVQPKVDRLDSDESGLPPAAQKSDKPDSIEL